MIYRLGHHRHVVIRPNHYLRNYKTDIVSTHKFLCMKGRSSLWLINIFIRFKSASIITPMTSQIRYLLYFVPIMNIDNRRGNLKSVPKKFGLLVLNNVKTFLAFKLRGEPLATNVFTYLSSSFIAANASVDKPLTRMCLCIPLSDITSIFRGTYSSSSSSSAAGPKPSMKGTNISPSSAVG